MSKFLRVWDSLERATIGNVAIWLFLGGALLCLVEVIRRYVFSISFPWGAEFVTYGMLSGMWLYFGITLVEGGHLRVSIVTDRIDPRLARYFRIFADVVGIAFCAILARSCVLVAIVMARKGVVTEATATSLAVPLPMAVIFSVIGLGLMLMVIRYIEAIYRSILIILHGHAESEEEAK